MIFFKATKLLILLVSFSFLYSTTKAQIVSEKISGIIKNEKGESLEAASVQVKGKNEGTSTDKSGNFSLMVSSNDILIISYVGYDTLQVKVRPTMRLVLHLSIGILSNDVVVIGYGSVRKQELTGSVSTVTAKDFQQGTISSPEQLIAGKVAGVSITSNGGNPGSASTIRIRGLASLNGSQDPLIIIDGLPIDQDLYINGQSSIAGASNPLSMINPNDIESFTILKDGASTAIYGSRASNGVIIITTKKGVKGKPVFSFTTNTSMSTVEKEQDVLTAAQFRNYVNTSPRGDSIAPGLGVPFKSLLGNANTDWQKEIYRAAIATDNNLSITGSLKNLPYRLSVGYLDQNGLLKTDNLQRYSGGISLNPSLLHNNLKVTINVKGTAEDTRFGNGAAVSSAVYFDPTQPVYNASSPYGGYTEWSSGGVINKLAPRNPLALLELYSNISRVYRSYGNVQFDYKIPFISDLHANLNLGYDVSSGSGLVYVPSYAGQTIASNPGGQNNPYKSTINNGVTEFYLNYNKTIPSIKSNINATAGYGFYVDRQTQYYYNSFTANGDTVANTTPTYPTDPIENTLLSYYARLIYTYNVRYILAASVREDESSRFPNEGPSGTMPSVAFTWRINKEKFLANAKKLSLLNLRLSYGVTGNQAGIGDYLFEPVYYQSVVSSQVQFGNEFYSPATPIAYNPNIKWEKTAASNIGIDYGFFNNRISGNIDAYYKNTTGLLNDVPVPAGTNFNNVIKENIGTLYNKGIEFTINAIPIQTQRFSWSLNFNVAYNETEITKLNNGNDSASAGSLNNNTVQINSTGYEPDAFYVYHQEYDKAGKPIEGVYADLNGDGIIDTKDLYHDHSPFPKFVFGFSTQFSLDKWSLSAVFRANIGNYVYNSVAAGAAQSNTFNSLGYLANSLTELTTNNFYYNQPLSDLFVQNASFLKMDELTIGYNVGKFHHNKLNLHLSAYCQNVFTITKYTGIDPEIYGGYDAALYPRPRIFGLGANLQF
jgi:TonB-linked SusC/RagA family outer membrane protein